MSSKPSSKIQAEMEPRKLEGNYEIKDTEF